MFCANCACELPAVAKFCVRCGSTVESSTSATATRVATPPVGTSVEARSVRCLKCGEQNPSGYSFCTACGALLRPVGSPVFVSNTVTAFRGAVPAARNEPTASEVQRTPVTQQGQGETATPSPLQTHVAANFKKTDFVDSNLASSQPYAIANTLVVPRNSVLPARCVKCGNTPTDPWLRKTFSWHHRGYYFFLISPILYVIIALIVRKRVEVSIPLCKTHKSIRRKRLWVASILLFLCIPLPVVLGTYIGTDTAVVVVFWLGIAMFIAGLFFLAYAPPLRAIHISSASAEFTGACPEFLTSLSTVSTNESYGRLQGAEIKGAGGMPLVYVGIALIALLILAAIAIPNLLRARIAANESSAVDSLRTINTAETSYVSAYRPVGYATTLTVLGGTICSPPNETSACLIDTQLASGQKSGYRFEIRNRVHSEIEGDKYQVVAYPLVFNQTGVRAFCSDETAVIKFDVNGSPNDCLANGSVLQ
jgi:type IV pilus assembly protein PilA